MAPRGAAHDAADGYARGTGRVAFVNLHAAAGLANGTLGLLDAMRSRTPLVVLGCQQEDGDLLPLRPTARAVPTVPPA